MGGISTNPGPNDSQSIVPKESQGYGEDSPDVDPNLLLLLSPNKRVREFGNLAEAAKNGSLTDADKEVLKEYAQVLINSPELPPGAKQALQNWLSTLASFSQNQNPQGLLGEDGQPLPTTPAPVLPDGLDPNLLDMNQPGLKPQTQALGNLAKTMAASQGGKLTPEEVLALKGEAAKMLADPNLPEVDRATLQAFVAELYEYPQLESTEEPETSQPTGEASEAAGSNPTGTTTRSSTANPQSLLMNDPQLSEELKELGQMAKDYAQGNGGPLTREQVTQLKGLAQQLINNGAIDPDLETLTKFIAKLDSYPTAIPTQATGLLLTQAGLNPKLVNLAQYADMMAKASGGTLTPDEAALLQGMAESMMSELSPEEQQILKNWLEAALANFPTKGPPPISLFDESMLFGADPGHNPYMEPGIMSMLAPILSELFVIYADILRQSSKLKQSMMQLMVAMAKEAFNFAIAAGKAKANQLQNEANKYTMLGITGLMQAGLQVAAFGMQKRAGNKAGDEFKAANKSDATAQGGMGQAKYKLAKSDHINKAEMSSYGYFANTLFSNIGGAAQNFVSAAYTQKNVAETALEAENNAMKEMITQLMQLLQQTIQSSSDEMAAAQKNWEGMVELFKNFSQTISQGIYRS